MPRKCPTGESIVAIINKDASKDLELALPGFGVAERLTAESLTSTNVKFDPVRSVAQYDDSRSQRCDSASHHLKEHRPAGRAPWRAAVTS